MNFRLIDHRTGTWPSLSVEYRDASVCFPAGHLADRYFEPFTSGRNRIKKKITKLEKTIIADRLLLSMERQANRSVGRRSRSTATPLAAAIFGFFVSRNTCSFERRDLRFWALREKKRIGLATYLSRLLGRVFASRWAELADVTDLSHESALVHMWENKQTG